MERIDSHQNPRIKNAAKLRERRQREKQGRFIIDGVREISRAVQCGIELDEVFVSQSSDLNSETRDVVADIASRGTRLVEVSSRAFAKLIFGDRNESLLAVAKTPKRNLGDLKLGERATVGILEGVEKPGNVGAVIRTADAAGVDAIFVADGGTDLFNPNAVRASLGTIFRVPVFSAKATDVIAWLEANEFHTFVARVDGAIDYLEADYRGRSAIVLGSEAHGVSEIWKQNSMQAIRIPMNGIADSLNVSATAAVLFFEAYRQRLSVVSKRP